MRKNYLTKIIARDNEGVQMISACCSEAKLKISEIKYLPQNKIFLINLERFKKEGEVKSVKVNSICKFEFIDKVKSKNIDQNSSNLVLKLIAVDIIKNNENFEINLIFSDNAYIILSTEIIEVTLEDQNQDI
jgi:hypothetical protein|tara:strand:- start:134 stop:529 length:396 start_codon:yes stop_codon:yes gene_type:complete